MMIPGHHHAFCMTVIAFACLSAVPDAAESADYQGKGIVVGPGDVFLRQGTQTVGKIGNINVWIDKIEGEWVHVQTDDNRNGWLKQGQVVRMDQAEAYLAGRIDRNSSDTDALYLRAMARLSLGKLDQALPDINAAIRLRPAEAMLYHCRGMIWNKKEDYDRALADFNQAINIGPEDAYYYHHAARSRLGKKEYDKAISNYSEALRLDPQMATAYQGRAVARAFKGGDPVRVFEDFGKSRRLHPDLYDWTNEDLWMGDVGDAYFRAEHELQSLPDDRLAQFHPQDTEEFALRGSAWMHKANFARAAQDYGEAMHRQPADAGYPRHRGWALFQQGQLAAAISDYDTAIRLAPKSGSAHNERGVIRLRLDDYSGALADFDQAILLNEFDDLPKLNRGWAHYRQKDYAKAAADFATVYRIAFRTTLGEDRHLRFRQGWSDLNNFVEPSLKFEPLDAYVVSVHGQIQGTRGDADRALADFQAADALDPKLPLAAYGRAQLHLRQAEKQQAIVEFGRAIERCPEFAQAYWQRGLVHGDLRQHAEAVADYESAIKLGLKTTEIYSALAWNFDQRGEPDRARASYDEALRLNPKASWIYSSRGWLRFRGKDYKGAFDDFNDAVRVHPNYAPHLNSRGIARRRLGQYREAIADYKAAMTAVGANADPASNLAWLLATCPDASLRDGQQAVKLARQACEQGKWKVPGYLESLAAACAEVGDFDGAVKWQTQVLELASAADKELHRARLALFQSRKPFRE